MKKNNWNTCPSEVLISTPRRFGKVRRACYPYNYCVHACVYPDFCSAQADTWVVRVSFSPHVSQTFSIGIFAACLALTMKCEIVVFSPARRASRKLLERMVEVRQSIPTASIFLHLTIVLCAQFIRLLGHEPVEYNQEQCRVNTYDGRQALIRSFPSKVGVSF